MKDKLPFRCKLLLKHINKYLYDIDLKPISIYYPEKFKYNSEETYMFLLDLTVLTYNHDINSNCGEIYALINQINLYNNLYYKILGNIFYMNKYTKKFLFDFYKMINIKMDEKIEIDSSHI